jgi:UDP-N-acetylmuramate dehydrogenase
VECLSGIPGLVGAAPIQNVGAYGQEVSETIARVEAVDRRTGVVRWFTNEECRFAYRQSIFKNEAKDQYIILSVTFRLQRGGEPAVRYPELERAMEGRARTLALVRETVLDVRRRKGMVLDPADPDTRSDGSFFMNPIVAPDLAASLGSGAPAYPMSDGRVKLSAAWLIEQAGFEKGFTLGRVGLSSKHTLAIINRGDATATEALALVKSIQDRVHEKFGVELHPEPNFVGFS